MLFRSLLVCRIIAPGKIIKSVEDYKESDSEQKKRLVSDIEYAKNNSDVVIMCLHCGGQFNKAPTKYTKETAEFCFDRGVDIIVGNHEHIVQGSDFSSEKKIAYCLGNFSSNYSIDRGPYDKNAECSVLLHLSFDKNDGNISVEPSFSVMISMKDRGGRIVTSPLFDAYCSGEDIQHLTEANTKCVNSFLGTSFKSVEPKEEYIVSDLIESSKQEVRSC